MARITILGAGSAGTMLANRLVKSKYNKEMEITVIDCDNRHYYQPGFLFIPFGMYTEKQIVKPRDKFLPSGVNYILEKVSAIEPEKNTIVFKNGDKHEYDFLVIATGARIVPDEIEGLADDGWRKDIFDFYTPDGAIALGQYLENWQGGKMVLSITEMPIKCPVAPLEFLFLADWWFTKKGMRDKVDITLATPLDGAFTKQTCNIYLSKMIKEKNIEIVPHYSIGEVDNENKVISSYDGKEIEYDLLVSVPTNMGAEVIEDSGFGDELSFVPTEKHTLQSKVKDNIFVVGDATDLPSSKAGSVAHFQVEILTENLINRIHDKELVPGYDGHTNCFIESGYGKGILIDFNYEIEPLPGHFPIPKIGPFGLLKETHINHWGKLAFRWIYWHMLLRGRDIPFVKPEMSKSGKVFN